ncbi:MAG TPA: hypothetical protein VG477_17635 [Thermoanaerobaculia bacterium]|nr:hypothetical protein [Thermoanaerobaculia bacterium]
MRGEAEASDRRRVVRHLLTGCAQCTAMTRRFWSLGEARSSEKEDGSALRPSPRGSRAPRRLAELLDLAKADRLERIRSDERFQTPALCELLIQESRSAGDAVAAAERGEEAVAVAERLDERRHGSTLVRSFRARAWAYFGNGRRRARSLKSAEAALATAERLAGEDGEPIDPLDRAEVEELAARLLADQGKPGEAERRLEQALEAYRTLGMRHLQGRVLVQQGAIRGWLPGEGAASRGIEQLREGMALLDVDEDPALAAFAFHRLALLLLESGVEGEALRALYRARRLYQELEDGPNLVRLRHLEGRIAEVLGVPDVAEAAFLEARQNYLLESMGADAARVLLDLAILYRRQGRAPEILDLAQSLSPIFRTRDIRQEVALALMFFQRLAETGHTHIEVLLEVARFLAGPPKARSPMLR